MELIELRGVMKEYEKNKILEDVNLTIEEGDFLGVIGRSGSGKTTLLNMITGFIPPTEGEIVYRSKITGEEKNLTKNLHRIKKHIGFTPQHNSFYPKLTVKENIVHFGRLYGLQKNTLIGNAKTILEVTKLLPHLNKLSEHLSEGMQRRLDIACSLIHKPKILVLDEPTADLDPLLQKEILGLIQDVNRQGMTVVIASHNLESIEKFCNKVVIIHQGKMHSHGLIDEIKKPFLKDTFTISIQPGSNKEQIIRQLSKLPVEKIVDRGKEIVIYPRDIQRTVANMLQLIKEENLYLNDMDMRKPSLTEVFEAIARK